MFDHLFQVDLLWLSVQQLLGEDSKEAALRQPPEIVRWGELLPLWSFSLTRLFTAKFLQHNCVRFLYHSV